jgi:hypothetical protein
MFRSRTPKYLPSQFNTQSDFQASLIHLSVRGCIFPDFNIACVCFMLQFFALGYSALTLLAPVQINPPPPKRPDP